MKLIKYNLLVPILIIVGVVLIVLIGIFANKGSFSVRMSKTSVIKEMRALNKLETASFTIEKVIDAGAEGNQFQEILFGDRILLIAHGEVIAGFDLSKLTEKDITIDDKAIMLKLPKPEILVTRLDSDETRVYDRRQGLLTKGDSNLESQARQEAEKAITKAACQGKILEEASKNARTQLAALFRTLQFETVTIAIPEASC